MKSNQSLLGFYKFQCVSCEEKFHYPLPWLYLLIYSFSALAFLAGLLSFATMGISVCCFPVAFFGTFGIFRNFVVRREVKVAEQNARDPIEQLVSTFE